MRTIGEPLLAGRIDEVGALAAFLDDVRDGPSALLIEGEAGIGKTALWSEALGEARRRGYHVLVSRSVYQEIGLPFSGLADLLENVPQAALDALPRGERHAVNVAVAREAPGGDAVDQLAVSRGALDLMRTLSITAPTVVGIDDLP